MTLICADYVLPDQTQPVFILRDERNTTIIGFDTLTQIARIPDQSIAAWSETEEFVFMKLVTGSYVWLYGNLQTKCCLLNRNLRQLFEIRAHYKAVPIALYIKGGTFFIEGRQMAAAKIQRRIDDGRLSVDDPNQQRLVAKII